MKKLNLALHRKRSATPRSPRRTFNELVELFDVPRGVLAWLLRRDDAPKGTMYRTCDARKHYYDLAEIRKWWASLPDDVKTDK